MAINLDTVREDESEILGNVTVRTAATGDVGGDFTTGLTVSGIQGRAVTNTAPTLEQAYVWNPSGNNFIPQRVVLFDKDMPFSGTIRGNYDVGVNLFGIYNSVIKTTTPVPSFSTAGEGLVYDGADFLEVKQLNPSRNMYVVANMTAENRDTLFCNSTAGAITISPPAAPVNGYFFTVYLTKSAATVNAVTVDVTPTSVDIDTLGAVIFIFDDGGWVAQNIGSARP